MGRIDRSNGQGSTMARRHIQQVLRHIKEYEQVKRNQHPKYVYAQDFYEVNYIVKKNYLKYYPQTNKDSHPFEKLLNFVDIKHIYTRPARPQTNGKIERFGKTLENELLSGETIETMDEFKHYIRGYCIYYNEHHMHQGINLKISQEMLK